ncbi:outer membrane beta-barrel protein [Niabella drilacis]|uniref:Outer membrane protein beta-barrel family protein n=1 Tax=Niabella drilacis (strain DSM 25811 / CCM 8410 / CCUG 62505 / LMG 26954 / E90) TaxID=1285928 RepID=A0A1G6LRD0_NIADE|nr:outer membrane beta-barrel protein [Niabella drilacis]SDC45266.1 Outer membrane protein beta-barrel family protein [Niabella drilacis]
MRIKKTIFLLLFAMLQLAAYSQKAALKGQLVDSSEHKSLRSTVVALLRAKDSVLVSFTRADEKGHFSIPQLDSGRYIMMTTHPYFAEYFNTVTLAPQQQLDLGVIQMLSKMKLMEEVVIKGNKAMFMSGDTTVFTADSFKVSEGANVEELFRKLPGFQVDKDGKITALGKKVERLLVDGEEFFGDDPGIASKNLKADNVKEVQVYEGKSDQAAFTGIDDGQSKQTINLKLKEDRKKGYFGKIEAGGGLKGKREGEQDKFNNAVMLNAFKGKRKIAAYGIMSNTGKLNLDWQDQDKYGSSSSGVQVSDNGDMQFDWNDDDYVSSEGTPTNWNLGLHYNNKFNMDKQSLNAGYRLVKINTPATLETFGANYLADSAWKSHEKRNNYTSSLKHAANLTLEFKLDSMNTLKFTTRGNSNNSNAAFTYFEDARTMNDEQLIYSNNRHGKMESDNSALTSNLLWMHKFKKLYRTLSVNIGGNYSKTNTDELLYSSLVSFKNGDTSDIRKIDQHTLGQYENRNLNTRVSYTEPLMKDTYMELNYGFSSTRSVNDREVYGYNDISGQYDQFTDSLSNDFLYKVMANSPGVNFKLNKKKLNATIGGSAGFTSTEQYNRTDGTDRPYDFVNYTARGEIRYMPKQSVRLLATYYGNSSAPSLNDLQPIITNSDPTNIKKGNQDLKPSFSNVFRLSYSSFKMSTERNLWTSIVYGFTSNAFTTFSQFSNAVRTYYTVNTGGVSYLSSYIDYGFKLKKSGIRLGSGARLSVNNNVDFVMTQSSAAVKNKTQNNNYNLNLSVGKDEADKYYIYWSPTIGYNTSRGSVNKLSDYNYWSYGFNIYGNLKLPRDLEIKTDLNATYRQKDPRFPANNNFTIWNAFLTKSFHKKEFEARISVYDILDQNRGYTQSRSGYSFTDSYRNTLRRLWLVSFIWNITRNGASPAKK